MSDVITPSQQIVNDAANVRVVTDSRGRSLKVKRLNALDRMRLFNALGPERVQNQMTLGYAMLAGCVTHIDGVPLPFPKDNRGIEHSVGTLDDDGINAVSQAFSEEIPQDEDEATD